MQADAPSTRQVASCSGCLKHVHVLMCLTTHHSLAGARVVGLHGTWCVLLVLCSAAFARCHIIAAGRHTLRKANKRVSSLAEVHDYRRPLVGSAAGAHSACAAQFRRIMSCFSSISYSNIPMFLFDEPQRLTRFVPGCADIYRCNPVRKGHDASGLQPQCLGNYGNTSCASDQALRALHSPAQ